MNEAHDIDLSPLDAFQDSAAATAAYDPAQLGTAEMISYLGLASEAGSLLNVIKKRYLFDAGAAALSSDFVAEELGDVLWYLAMVATGAGLRLSDVAARSLTKTRSRYRIAGEMPAFDLLDEAFPPKERFPRTMVFHFEEGEVDGQVRSTIRLIHADPNAFPDGSEYDDAEEGPAKRRGYSLGEDLGSMLTDNSRRVDGYRYHDAIHMSFASCLGWSPVLRDMLRIKRKSDPVVDEVDDGARAIFTEEAIAAAVTQMAARRNGFGDEITVDSEVLDLVQALVRDLEVQHVPLVAWRPAVVAAMSSLRALTEHAGGYLVCDLAQNKITYFEPGTDPVADLPGVTAGSGKT